MLRRNIRAALPAGVSAIVTMGDLCLSQVQPVFLPTLRLERCRQCDASGWGLCRQEGRCVIDDDFAGIVEKVGPGVTGYREGMRVAVAPNMGCGVCDRCVSGNTQLCADYRAFGINIDGGFAERQLVPAAAVRQGNLSEMPAGVDFAAAAVVEPLSCVYNAFQRCAIGPGDTVLVMGSGPIGLMHARLAKMGGAAKVFMNDINAERLAWCAGLEKAITPVESPNLAERLRDETHGRGVDVVITANPAPESQVAALESGARRRMDVGAINGRYSTLQWTPVLLFTLGDAYFRQAGAACSIIRFIMLLQEK